MKLNRQQIEGYLKTDSRNVLIEMLLSVANGELSGETLRKEICKSEGIVVEATPVVLVDEVDYQLKDERVWVGVDNISVHIVKTEEGVVVDLYPKGLEDRDPLSSTYAFSSEAQENIEEEAA